MKHFFDWDLTEAKPFRRSHFIRYQPLSALAADRNLNFERRMPMPYIEFTDSQKQRAAAVDLEAFLLSRGERLLLEGRESRLASDHSVTVQGNEWFDHATKEGGGPVTFVQKFYGLSYPEAMSCLLNGEQGEIRSAPPKQKEKREFQLPPRNGTMRRVYAYLLKQRLISRNVLDTFVHAGLIYESREPSQGGNDYHNAVFVGLDEHGVPRHAHKRGLYSSGPGLKRNVGGCDARYSFHYTGASSRLYIFEAPVDLLSFLTLYQKDWQAHSYAALCGTSEHAMLWMLEQNPHIQNVLLCLDHDEAGIEASGRLTDILRDHGYSGITVLQPENKDWNEDLKAAHGLPALPAEEHPQLIVAPDVCQFIAEKSEELKPDSLGSLEKELPRMLQFFQNHLRNGEIGKATLRADQASALALAAYRRELRQLDTPMETSELSERLRANILPHQNRAALKSRHRELSTKMQAVLKQSAAPGIRSAEDKRQLAKAWLDLAAGFAKVTVKYEAEEWKKWQKQQQVAKQAMTM